MHDDTVAQSSQPRCCIRDVDWVAVTSNNSKWMHRCRCSDRELMTERRRSIRDVLRGVHWFKVLFAGAADDCKAFFQASQLCVLEFCRIIDIDGHRYFDDATNQGVTDFAAGGGNGQLHCLSGKSLVQAKVVLQVHQVQQALNHAC